MDVYTYTSEDRQRHRQVGVRFSPEHDILYL